MTKGLFVGLAGFDLIFYKDSAPAENKKMKTTEYSTCVGGPAANAAITFSLLGGEALLVSCIGDSPMGKLIKLELEGYRIRVLDLAEGETSLPSISGILVNTLNGSRTIWNGQPDLGACTKDLSEWVSEADFLLTDCNLKGPALESLKMAQKKNIPRILDAGSWKDYMSECISLATDVIASEDCVPPDGEELFSLCKDLGVLRTAITRGEGPISWQEAGLKGEVIPPRVQAVDTLGAGDIFHGAYGFFLIQEKSGFESALKKAAEVAASSVRFRGPREGVVKIAEVQHGSIEEGNGTIIG